MKQASIIDNHLIDEMERVCMGKGNNQENKVLANDDEPLVKVSKGKRWIYFLILYGLFMSDFIARLGVNSIFPILQNDLQLTDSQVGALASVVLLGMSVFVLPVSFWGEKRSPKKAITLSALVWSVGSVLSGMASSFAVLVTSRFLVGAGNAAYAPLSNSLLTSMYPKSQWGKTIGTYNTAMTIGGAAGALIFVGLANSFGWRMTFYIIGGISLVLTALSLLLPDVRSQVSGESEGKQSKVNVKDACAVTLNNKALLTMCIGAGIGIMALQAIGAWTSIYFVRIMGMSLEQAAAMLGGIAILAALGYPIGGVILDKWYKKDKRSRMWMPAICFILCAVCYTAGFYFQNLILIVAGQVVYTFGGTSFHTATQELVPVWFKSVSYGFYVLFIQFLGALGPICAGFISDAVGLVNALLCVQILYVIAAIVLFFSGFSYVKYYNLAREAEGKDAANNTTAVGM